MALPNTERLSQSDLRPAWLRSRKPLMPRVIVSGSAYVTRIAEIRSITRLVMLT